MKIPLNIPLYIFLILIGFLGFLLSMFVQESISLAIFIIFTAAGGFLLSLYILYVKHCGKPMVCPTGSSCDTVIYSEYSKFFGIPLEYLGVLYYGILIATYITLITSPGSIHQIIISAVLLSTSGAFLFSLYLTSIQAFVLKQWCMWCILSAVFSTTIFIVSLSSLSKGTAFLIKIQPILFTANIFAFALGVGAATIASVLFFKFLKDRIISKRETNILKTISQVIWLSIAILILTEFALYLPETVTLNSSSQFLAKIFAIIVITVTGVIINLIILPRLIAVPFNVMKDKALADFIRLRKIIFIVGAVAISSWYFAFILGTLPELSFKFSSLIAMYALLLLSSITISLIVERKISRGKKPLHKKTTHR